MKTPIFKTHQQAITSAKDTAISSLEKIRGRNYSTSYCKKIKADRKNWLLTPMTAQCLCGETSAVEAVLFIEGQHYGYAGYCSSCGERNPMP